MTNNTNTVHRPWGFYSVIAEGENYKVKRIYIKKGHRLSLQRHTYRSEHWTIVKGTAFVTIDGVSSHREPGVAVHVPLGAVHRIAAPLDEVIFIEVQTGPYLGEDDIERLEDDYNRTDLKIPESNPKIEIKVAPLDFSPSDTARVDLEQRLALRLAEQLSRETGLRLEPYDAKRYEQFDSAEEPEQEKSAGPCDCGNPEVCFPEDKMKQPSFLVALFRQRVISISDVIALKMNHLISHAEAREILELSSEEQANRAQ